MPQFPVHDAASCWTVVQISDLHLPLSVGGQKPGYPCPDACLAQVLDTLARAPQRPDVLVLSGDLVDRPDPGAYRRIGVAVQRALPGVAVLATPGNHDDPVLLDTAGEAFGWQTRGVLALGDLGIDRWRLALVSSWLEGHTEGEVGTPELDAWDAAMRVAADVPTLVFTHHPPLTVGSAWMDRIGMRNGDALRARLEAVPGFRACGFGHVHQAFSDPSDRYHACPSSWVQFAPGADSFALDTGKSPGYRLWHLHRDGGISTTAERVPTSTTS